jgi:hypothetical protein
VIAPQVTNNHNVGPDSRASTFSIGPSGWNLAATHP